MSDVSLATLLWNLGTKETAFIYAILSAGVVHSVTQACSAGNLTDCSCDMSRYGEADVEGWKWGGCSDNVNYGLWFARNFVDAPETMRHENSRNIRNLMNLHNNEVGRKPPQTFKHSVRDTGPIQKSKDFPTPFPFSFSISSSQPHTYLGAKRLRESDKTVETHPGYSLNLQRNRHKQAGSGVLTPGEPPPKKARERRLRGRPYVAAGRFVPGVGGTVVGRGLPAPALCVAAGAVFSPSPPPPPG
ncbi:hypothetical protein ACOMHN_049304 [Nucella lapillus]